MFIWGGSHFWIAYFVGTQTSAEVSTDFHDYTILWLLFLFMFFFYLLMYWRENSIKYVWFVLLFVFQISTQSFYQFSNYFKCCFSNGIDITGTVDILTLILLETKVISLCHQNRARPTCISVQSDQALYCWLTISSFHFNFLRNVTFIQPCSHKFAAELPSIIK